MRAVLDLPAGHFELTAQSWEDYWIQTDLTLHFAFGNTRLSLSGAVSLLETDFCRLVADIRWYIRALQNRKGFPDEDAATKPRVFVPLDLAFSFALLDGDVGPDLEGEITIRIMFNLELADRALSSNYVGGEFNVPAQRLMAFAETVETEVARLS